MAGARYRDVRYWITLRYLTVLRRMGFPGVPKKGSPG